MKSSLDQLKKRGYLEASMLQLYEGRKLEELISSINPVERTAGYLQIGKSNQDVDLAHLLECLKVESALYSKIALCDTLSRLEAAVPYLVANIGIIGNNQHYKIPDKVFEKKSYPLPRDICSRTLIRMRSDVVFPILLQQSKALPIPIISEFIDVIGHLSFYHPNNHYYHEVKNLVALKEDLIRYKYVIMLRSFILQAALDDAQEILRNESNVIIKQELERSIARIIENL